MAFEDDTLAFGERTGSPVLEEELRTAEGQRFTHIIKIRALKSMPQPPGVSYTMENETHILTLDIPSRTYNKFDYFMRTIASTEVLETVTPETAYNICADFNDPHGGITLLSLRQMLMAREFLSWASADIQFPGSVQALITAPRDHCTDMVSVVGCYLAHLTRNHATVVLHQINEEKSLRSIWKNCVSEEGVTVIQEAVDYV
ncbi:hypothetical protein BDP27DRAFT_1360733 [Rhodocollybia butyracea]|uniref:Uncharacterized protein n=1 Tax=Rhodocollybia butyracea TaxID=206335 RepID=A0A9P5UAF2_9AGAR|nr:hypothetical protein BDP27DRAFT_1360733 [Rhodocollybia butyracea]